jgi:gamma-butyrobetaine dioxygenase
MAFDNLRILHGRDAYTAGDGARWLRGCYSERDELESRIRLLERERRRLEGEV